MVCSYCDRLHTGGYGVFIFWQVTWRRLWCVHILAGYIEAVMVCSYCDRLHRGGYGVFIFWQVT